MEGPGAFQPSNKVSLIPSIIWGARSDPQRAGQPAQKVENLQGALSALQDYVELPEPILDLTRTVLGLPRVFRRRSRAGSRASAELVWISRQGSRATHARGRERVELCRGQVEGRRGTPPFSRAGPPGGHALLEGGERPPRKGRALSLDLDSETGKPDVFFGLDSAQTGRGRLLLGRARRPPRSERVLLGAVRPMLGSRSAVLGAGSVVPGVGSALRHRGRVLRGDFTAGC